MRDLGVRPGITTFLLAAQLATALILPAHAMAGKKWDPIPPQELALAASPTDPEAGAEVTSWTISVEDQLFGSSIRTVVHQEIRTKVFTAKGAEEAGRVELPHLQGVDIEEIAARTVRADGSVVDLRDDQIFDQTLVKGSAGKVNAKAFAFPAVAPGCTLEYRWTEIRHGEDAGTLALEFQRELPVRTIALFLKPLPIAGSGFNFRMRTFNMATPAFEERRDGVKYAVLPSVPARRTEPYMPPRYEVTPWALLYYTYGPDPSPDEIWKRFAGQVLQTQEPAMRADGTVKAMAHAIVAGSTSTGESADRLNDWCRTNVDDSSDDRLRLSESERAKLPRNRNPSDTLKRRRGTPLDLVRLFIAMCRSVDVDARLAAAADRSQVHFDSALGLPQLLDHYCAAVRSPDGWRFYDPSERWRAAGRLAWFMEGEDALVLDRAKPVFVKTPLAPPESSVTLRSARLRLGADGSVAGVIRSEYRGHKDAEMHEIYDELSPGARAELFRKGLPVGMREAAFDSIRIEGVESTSRPVVASAMVKIAGYAQPTGDRLLVPLSFFERDRDPVFPAATRRLPVSFAYPWGVSDTVRIEIPVGYEVESIPDAESTIDKGAARFRGDVYVSADRRSVLYVRTFLFGVGGIIAFPPESYPSLKGLFDGVRQRDETMISLKRIP